MIFIAYDDDGIVQNIAYSLRSMIPENFNCMEISEENWKQSQGKERKVINGVFVFNDPAPTKQELSNFVYEQKSRIAYGGVAVVKDGNEYIFETDQNSITMCNSQALAFSALPEEASVNWKVYQNNFPVFLTLTKIQFMRVFAFGMQMINSSFSVESDYNEQINDMTEQQLNDSDFVQQFKNSAITSFNTINRQFNIDE